MPTQSSYSEEPVLHSPKTTHLKNGWQQALMVLHSTPIRHYHSFRHVEEVVHNWALVERAGLWSNPVTSWVAAVLHDAVYVAGATDNEARSAELVVPWCAEWIEADVDVETARSMILLTATHGSCTPPTADAALFLDCDMAILGSKPERFAEYENQIRAEWEPVVGATAFAVGRARFLRSIAGQRIYHSAFWHDRLEGRAQHNLLRQLSSFKSPETSGTQ